MGIAATVGKSYGTSQNVEQLYHCLLYTSFISIIAAAALEEMVFRQIMIGGIFGSMSLDPLPAVILSGFFYGMNHVYFGRFAVIQKFSSGIVFALLYVLGGGNIFLPGIRCV